MNWPVSQDYNEAVQNAATSFSDPALKKGEVVCNALGLPVPRSGNFADVYEFKGGDGKKWALKCFTRKVAGLQERYAKIDEHLSKAKFPFTVGFKYMAEGIRVQGEWFPLLKMEWVEGFTLNEFIRDNADKKQYLHALMQMWGKLTALLRDANFAHADLQHGNVLLVPATSGTKLGLRLIDYDGMWVPSLAETHSGEVGHPNFQHPLRLKDRLYNADVDRFPHLVIASALRATLLGGKELWNKFDNGDNLLFKESDLRDPANAPVFKALWGLNDPVLCALVGKLALSVKEPLRKTPWLDDVLFEQGGPRLSPDEERKAIELLGVKSRAAAVKVQGAGAAPSAQDEYNVFAMMDDEEAGSGAVVSSRTAARKPYQRATAQKKSLTPFYIGGGVAAVLAVVGIIAMSGGKKDPTQPEVAKVEKKDEPPPPKKIDTPVPPPKKFEVPPKKDETPPKKNPEIIAKKDGGDLAEPQRLWKNGDGVNFNSLTFSSDGSRLLRSMAREPETIQVHDPANGKPAIEKIAAPLNVASLRMGPRDILGITTLDSKFAAFDWKKKQLLFMHDIPKGVELCPFAEAIDAVVVPDANGKVVVLALADGKVLQSFDLADPSPIKGLDCSRDGKTIVACTASGELYAKTADAAAFKSIYKLTTINNRKVYLSPDSAYVAMTYTNGIHLHETATGAKYRSLTGHRDSIRSVAFVNNGRNLLSVSKDKTLRTWDIEGTRQLHSIDLDGEGKTLAVSADGQSLALATENAVTSLQVWRLAGGVDVAKKDPDPTPKVEMKKDPDPAMTDDLTEVWAKSAGTFLTSLSFSKDGSRLATSTRALDLVFVDAKNGSVVDRQRAADKSISALTLAPNDQVFIVDQDKNLVVWDAKAKKKITAIEMTCGYPQQFAVLAGQDSILLPLLRGEIGVYSLKDGAKSNSFKTGSTFDINWVSATPDGESIVAVTAAGEVYGKLKGEAAFRMITSFQGGGHRRVAIAPDGKSFAFALNKEPIRICDTTDGKERHALEGHTGELLAIQYTPDGKYLLSIARDETLRRWNPASGRSEQEVKLAVGQVLSMAVSPDGKSVATGGTTGTQLWRLGGPAETVVAKKDPDPMPKIESKKDPVPPLVIAEGLVKSSETLSDRLCGCFYSTNGKVLYVAARNGVVHVLDPLTLTELAKHTVFESGQAVHAVAGLKIGTVAPNQKDLLYVWDDKKHVHAYDPEKKTVVKDMPFESQLTSPFGLPSPNASEFKLATTPNGRLLMLLSSQDRRSSGGGFGKGKFGGGFGGYRRPIVIWDVTTNAAGGLPPLGVDPFNRSTHVLNYSADSTFGAASTGSKLQVWSGQTGATIYLRDIERDSSQLAVVSEARVVVVAGEQQFAAWNFSTKKEIWNTRPPDADSTLQYQGLVAIPKSRRIAFASGKEIVVRDAATGADVMKWTSENDIFSLDASADGKFLIAEHDRKVSLWSLSAPKKP